MSIRKKIIHTHILTHQKLQLSMSSPQGTSSRQAMQPGIQQIDFPAAGLIRPASRRSIILSEGFIVRCRV